MIWGLYTPIFGSTPIYSKRTPTYPCFAYQKGIPKKPQMIQGFPNINCEMKSTLPTGNWVRRKGVIWFSKFSKFHESIALVQGPVGSVRSEEMIRRKDVPGRKLVKGYSLSQWLTWLNFLGLRIFSIGKISRLNGFISGSRTAEWG